MAEIGATIHASMSFEGPFKASTPEEPNETVSEVASTFEGLKAKSSKLDAPKVPEEPATEGIIANELTPEGRAALKAVLESLEEKE